jgi:hypothetical protein
MRPCSTTSSFWLITARQYDFCHLTALRRSRIDPVIPGALSADGVFVSSAGAAIGGPALRKSIPVEACLQLVEALQLYCKSAGWRGIEVTLPPPIYHDEPDQGIEFTLHVNGFQLVTRSMPLLIPLDCQKGNLYTIVTQGENLLSSVETIGGA